MSTDKQRVPFPKGQQRLTPTLPSAAVPETIDSKSLHNAGVELLNRLDKYSSSHTPAKPSNILTELGFGPSLEVGVQKRIVSDLGAHPPVASQHRPAVQIVSAMQKPSHTAQRTLSGHQQNNSSSYRTEGSEKEQYEDDDDEESVSGLISLLTARVRDLERQLQSQQQQLQQKEDIIMNLYSKVKRANSTADNAEQQYKSEILRLQQRVNEMELFLADYGLEWVGGGGISAENTPRAVEPAHSSGNKSTSHNKSEQPSHSKQPQQSPRSNSASAGVWRQASSSSSFVSAGKPTSRINNSRGSTRSTKEGSGSRSNAQTNSDDSNNIGGIGDFVFSMKHLQDQIKDLNFLAGEGVAKVVTEQRATTTATSSSPARNSVARLKVTSAIPLTIYRDGIAVLENFRSFQYPVSSGSAQGAKEFLQDILDGYFPFELKQQYPDGVPFQLVDRHTEFYQPPSNTRVSMATGASSPNLPSLPSPAQQPTSHLGQQLQAQPQQAQTKPKQRSHIATLFNMPSNTDQEDDNSKEGNISNQQPQQTAAVRKDQFLGKLPSVVIGPTGNVISVRDSISSILSGSPVTRHAGKAQDSSQTKPADNVLYLNAHATPTATPRPQSSGPTTTLIKVITEDGPKLVVKMKSTDTIHTLYQLLQNHLLAQHPNARNNAPRDFVLCSAFPPRRQYKSSSNTSVSEGTDNNAVTLQQAGLVPNATLLLRYNHPQ